MHSWFNSATKQPVRYTFPTLGPIPSAQRTDHIWLTEKMTVTHSTLAVATQDGAARVVWTPTTSTYRVQSSTNLTAPDWTNVPEPVARGFGQVNVSTPTANEQRYFRLIRP
jgi:hypothetical protein